MRQGLQNQGRSEVNAHSVLSSTVRYVADSNLFKLNSEGTLMVKEEKFKL